MSVPPPVQADGILYAPDVDAALETLRQSRAPVAQAILRRMTSLEARFLLDCQAGEVIPCPLRGRAKALHAKHGDFTNLYCCDLPGFWRLLYTIQNVEGRRYVLALELVDHRAYDVWF